MIFLFKSFLTGFLNIYGSLRKHLTLLKSILLELNHKELCASI